MNRTKFEEYSLQELAKGMGYTLESLAKVPIEKVEDLYNNYKTLHDAKRKRTIDEIVYQLEVVKND